MATYPILVDARPAYLHAGPPAESLLLTPLGGGTMLSHMQAQVAAVSSEPLTVLASFETDAEYQQAIRAAAGRDCLVVGAAQFEELVYQREPSDWLWLVDASRFPLDSPNWMDALRTPPAAAVARHLIFATNTSRGSHECVHLDPAGCVRRIQRYYDGVTWHKACGITGSLVPVAAARTVAGPLESLSALRQNLARRGALASDLHCPGTALDLRDECGLLYLMEHTVRSARLPRGQRPRSAMTGPCGQDGQIHPSARLIGEVVVQEQAIIDEGACVIGPALIGAGAHVGASAKLAHCLVLAGARVPPQATLRGRVFCGHAHEAGDTDRVPASPSWPVVLREEEPAAPVDQVAYSSGKRWMDLAIAALSVLLLAPLLAVIAVLVKLDSRGPVLFGHRREGRGGREFRCWKFRTMIVGADAQQRALYAQSAVDGPQFKLDHDPRITRVGHLLRKTNLDELPQLFNVLRGQMSLVGPRPSPFRENQICVPWRRGRLSVRPGITGLWQLCRRERDSGDFHQWIYYDLLYVRHQSWSLDVRILIATLITLGGRWDVSITRLLPGYRSNNEDPAAMTLRWPRAGEGRALAASGTRSYGGAA